MVRFENGVTAPVKASGVRHCDSESKQINQRHFGHADHVELVPGIVKLTGIPDQTTDRLSKRRRVPCAIVIRPACLMYASESPPCVENGSS
jgi:hypothetical protein